MNHGDVFLLDEISLADDSVLERLNSVLESSRTIILAEKGGDNASGVHVTASETFKLVATMNPGGDYGKKELSPALRNRFTEIWVPAVDSRDDLELIVTRTWKHDELRHFTASILDFVDWLCSRVGDRTLMNLRDIIVRRSPFHVSTSLNHLLSLGLSFQMLPFRGRVTLRGKQSS